MTQKNESSQHAARKVIGSFIEEEGADAVVIIYSKVKKTQTETHLIPYGNAHTCNALIDYAYATFESPNSYIEGKEEDFRDED